jgi:thiamine biosynthesis lipoprotein
LGNSEAVFTVRAFDKSIGKKDFVYRHVVDPRTGLPVKDVKAVTVIHESAVWANAAATALLMAGLDDWASIAGKMGVRSVMMITQDGTIYTSTAMEERTHWRERLEHQHLVP